MTYASNRRMESEGIIPMDCSSMEKQRAEQEGGGAEHQYSNNDYCLDYMYKGEHGKGGHKGDYGKGKNNHYYNHYHNQYPHQHYDAFDKPVQGQACEVLLRQGQGQHLQGRVQGQR